MFKEKLIEKISKYFRLNQFEAEKIFDDFFSIIMQGVKDDKIADVSNLGEFKVKQDEQGKSVEFMESRALKVTGQIEMDSKIEDKVREYRESVLNEKSRQFDKTYAVPYEKNVELTDTLNQTGVSESNVPPSTDVSSEKSISEQEVQEETASGFSDLFSVVKEETTTSEKIEPEPVERKEELENVIPRSAVELHKEIVSGEASTEESKSSNVDEIKTRQATGFQAPNESLYPAQKEKSRLKIYVTSIILFFSIVLLLIIFYPVIRQTLFKTEELLKTEKISQPSQEKPTEQPADEITQKPEEQKPEQLQQTEPDIEGLTKNSVGWADEKYKVIYVQIENNKYAVQESSWGSEKNAMKRIDVVNRLNISDFNGSVARVDLGKKGVWFRTRFGEFSSLGEARIKAEELINKEK